MWAVEEGGNLGLKLGRACMEGEDVVRIWK